MRFAEPADSKTTSHFAMTYDYNFIALHSQRSRTYRGIGVHSVVGDALLAIYGADHERYYQEIAAPTRIEDIDTPAIVRCNGAYFKGGHSIAPLRKSLKTELPEDFKQFYEQFGESVIFTRSEPIRIMPLQAMIDACEDDPDIKVEEGRFFRFAEFSGMAFWLGFRRDDLTDEWQIVACDYGLLYSEMIGPKGRETVVALSFYEWLKALIETDGDIANLYPRYPFGPRLVVDDEPDKTS